MSLGQIVLLGVLQGITEFLPISSSGHLVIVPHLLGWAEAGLLVNAVLHLGTLLAIVIYFRRDLWLLTLGAWQGVRERSLAAPQARLAGFLVLGSIPGAVLGLLFEDWFESLFSAPQQVAFFLLVTAALLASSEYLARREANLEALAWPHVLLIGLAQSLAIIPGISRSGATIAAGLYLGYRREEATRFSFLLAVPIILGSGLYQVLKLALHGVGGAPFFSLFAGFCAAALAGYAAIAGLLTLVRRRSLWPFALYCVLFSLLILSGILG